MKVLVMEMMSMMPGVMAMMMAAISPSGREFPLQISPCQELFFSLSGFRLAEAAEYFFEASPHVFRSKASNTPKGSRRGATGTRGGSQP